MKIKIRHVRRRNGAYFFEATQKMRKAGMQSEALGTDEHKAIQRASELNAIWDQIRNSTEAVIPGTITWLIREYQSSTWYKNLSKASKVEADYHLSLVDAALGKAAAATIRRKHCRRFHEGRSRKASETNANKTMRYFRRLMNYAVELELIQVNPAAHMGLKGTGRRRVVWTQEELTKFIAKCREKQYDFMVLAIQIGYDTSQRLGDVLSLKWSQFDGEGFTFRQAKSGKEIWVPLEPETIKLLSETPRTNLWIINTPKSGKAFASQSYFAKLFREVRTDSGVREELTFHDLRRTAATEVLGGGGRAEPLTGHEPGSPVLRHYEIPSKAAARAAQEARKRGKE
jgi:integrase